MGVNPGASNRCGSSTADISASSPRLATDLFGAERAGEILAAS